MIYFHNVLVAKETSVYNSPTCLVTKLVLVVKINFVHYLIISNVVIDKFCSI